MLGTLVFCLLLAWIVGRALHIGSDLRTLIGVGTAICGASAIAAVTPTIRARNPDTTYAISTIFLLNVVAVLVFPPKARPSELPAVRRGGLPPALPRRGASTGETTCLRPISPSRPPDRGRSWVRRTSQGPGGGSRADP
jgi:hypothetical protein